MERERERQRERRRERERDRDRKKERERETEREKERDREREGERERDRERMESENLNIPADYASCGQLTFTSATDTPGERTQADVTLRAWCEEFLWLGCLARMFRGAPRVFFILPLLLTGFTHISR